MHEAHDHGSGADNFEPTDAKAMPIIIILAVLSGITFVTFVGGYFALGFAKASPAATSYQPSVLTESRQPWTQEVRLQADVRADYEAHYAETRPKLHAHGVVSENPEIYHFPIEDAMEHVAENGLPTFPVAGGTQ